MKDAFSVEIISKISKSASYLRNNKADGEKNVRCFPECSSDGHCASGFCGSSIKAILKTKDKNGSLDKAFLDRIIAVGEFMPSHFKPKILEDSVIPHCVLSQSATFSKYYRATLSFAVSDKISSAELEFNTNAKSWGYSYVAHRFKKESKHQFVISILIANEDVCKGEKTYTCVGIFRSTEFQIQCKRRAHNDAIQTVPFFHLCALKGKEEKVNRSGIRTISLGKRSLNTNSTVAVPPLITGTDTPEVSPVAVSEIPLPNVFSATHAAPIPFSDEKVLCAPALASPDIPARNIPIVRRAYSITASTSSRCHIQATWPLGIYPHPFATIHGPDAWAALVEADKSSCLPRVRCCLSTGRIALLQQLFAHDITPFCVY